MNNKKMILILGLAASVLLVFLTGCDDSGQAPVTPAGGPMPNIQLKAGSIYYYSNDTISQNGTAYNTTWLTKDSIRSEISFNGKNCYPINSVTRDTITSLPIQSQLLYVSYDSQSGQFFQWGLKKLFDPGQAESWDLVADFSQPLGTSVSLFTISSLFGQSFLSANVSSTVQYDTSYTTTGSAISVSCYKVGAVADILLSGISVGKAYLDYYVGYTPSSNPSNPSGRVRVKFYPVSLPSLPPVLGGDQKLNRFTIP